MARATRIWVIRDHAGRVSADLVAAFTVKWEMRAWLGRQEDVPLTWMVWQCGDGVVQEPPVLLGRAVDVSHG